MARLPDFLCVGAQRCGTYFLYNALSWHPEVGLGAKEPHYFDREYPKGPDWYTTRISQDPSYKVVGEFTPTYLFNPISMHLIGRDVPKAKIIVMLRDPVMRAYSHWALFRYGNLWRKDTQETQTFARSVEIESRRIEAGFCQRVYVSRGFYYEQMQRVFSIFPKHCVHIIRYEDLLVDSAQVLKGVCRFIGVGVDQIPAREVAACINARDARATGPDTETERLLRDLYRAPNQVLYELLGRDMRWPR